MWQPARHRHSHAAHGAGSLARCFAAAILYHLAARPQPVAPFHQVMFGNNGYYPASPGWNYAPGLGTPDVFDLAQDYAAFLRAAPRAVARSEPGDGLGS